MKTSKVSAAFLTKFSSFLSKFKSSETVNVAHEQIKKLFSQYSYDDIAVAFASKMDSCDNLSEKERKQYSKIYIDFMEVYGQQVILNHYERIIQSIAKKNIGVSQIIGYLCKSLLNRIYPTENISNYIQHLLGSFTKNIEILKIIKQIVQSFDPELTVAFQSDMVAIIVQKISQPRFKVQCLEAILAIILCHEQKFYEEGTIQHAIFRLFKNDDWTTRKLCVDISHALLAVKNQANSVFHQYIKQLKYDKIKHVRDSVVNYNALYKQIYGEQQKSNSKLVNQRQGNTKSFLSKSPNMPHLEQKNIKQPNHKSLEKSLRQTRNKQFFDNAKNKDIIKISQNKSTLVFNNRQEHGNIDQQTNIDNKSVRLHEEFRVNQAQKSQNAENNVNFENYLKNKNPKAYQNRKDNFMISPKNQEKINTNCPLISPKNTKNSLSFKKNSKPEVTSFQSKQISLQKNNLFQQQFESLKKYISQFEERITTKIEKIQQRVEKIQQNQSLTFNSRNRQKFLEQSFEKRFNGSMHESEVENHVHQSNQSVVYEQSNLPAKIRQNIIKKNWDQAFSLALANKNKKALFQLISHQKIPEDRLIQNCLLTEVRKNIAHPLMLQWILHYIQQAEIEQNTLEKLQKQVKSLPDKKDEADKQQRNNWMLKNMILNQISSKLLGE